MKINVDMLIKDDRWSDVHPILEQSFVDILETSLRYVLAPDADYIVELVLSNSEDTAKYNKEFFNKDTPTNVLSFPVVDSSDFSWEAVAKFVDNKSIILGSVLMDIEVIRQEALLQSKTPWEHVAHLFVHGVLHLIGFDHIDEADRVVMEDSEIRILSQFGIMDPYVSRD